MTTIESLEQTIIQLSVEEFAAFRQWFLEYDSKIWDEQIETDALAGKLDQLATEAIEEFEAGLAQEI